MGDLKIILKIYEMILNLKIPSGESQKIIGFFRDPRVFLAGFGIFFINLKNNYIQSKVFFFNFKEVRLAFYVLYLNSKELIFSEIFQERFGAYWVN